MLRVWIIWLGSLARLKIKTVTLTGETDIDIGNLKNAGRSGKGADAIIDFSSPVAATLPHLMTCLSSLRNGGRAVLTGGFQGNISLPYELMLFRNLKIQERFMFRRQDVEGLITMVEFGLSRLGKDIGTVDFRTFGLKEWEEGFKDAAELKGWGGQELLSP